MVEAVKTKAGEYHLHFWGSIENDGLAMAEYAAAPPPTTPNPARTTSAMR